MSHVSLLWKVHEHGYEWSHIPGTRMEAGLTPLRPWPTSEYDLQTKPTLFRTFASLDVDAASFVQFAGSHGLLLSRESGDSDETWTTWMTETTIMRSTLQIWDSIQDGRTDPLELAKVAETIATCCRDHVDFKYVFERADYGCKWIQVPRNLCGAMWLQFANAVTLRKKYGRCMNSECGDWFELYPVKKGPPRRYCSNACRQRSHRARVGAP